jgi:alpha-tubulin suppressor-like RCC1 family protein
MIITTQKLAAKALGRKPLGKGIKSFAMSALALKAMNSMMGSPGHHSAFIKSDGSLWTTGKNDDGQLANYTNSDLNSPTIVSLGSFAVSL